MSARSEKRKQINDLAEHWMKVALRCASDPVVVAEYVSHQKRPYTCVKVGVRWGNGPNDIIRVEGLGFSKVNWPDPWDEQHGIELALRKACFDAAQQVLEYDSNAELGSPSPIPNSA